MNVLLDTNVLSEVRRPAPDSKVLAWLDTIDEDRAFISVASIAELRRGIALMDDGRRRDALTAWLAEDLPARFAVRGDELGLDERCQHADAGLKLAARNFNRRQGFGECTFLEGAARGFGCLVRGSAAVEQGGCLGGQHLLGLVDLLAFQHFQTGDLVQF